MKSIKISSRLRKTAENLDIPKFVDTLAREAANNWFAEAVTHPPTERFYVYYKPSTATKVGKVRLFPATSKPDDSWTLAWNEGIRSNKTTDQVFYLLRDIIAKLPIIPYGKEKKAEAKKSKLKFKLGDHVMRDDASDSGEVSFGPKWDDLVGWKWKVKSDKGFTRFWWNETSMLPYSSKKMKKAKIASGLRRLAHLTK